MPHTPQTAVIGAGLAGLACARALTDAGNTVVVFDKGRGLGGRMATRRRNGWRFDHGAIALRPTNDIFTAFVASVQDCGQAAHWGSADGWAGVPGMSSVVKSLAKGLDIVTAERVESLSRTSAGWSVGGPTRAATHIFDRVVLAIPHPQALDLLQPWPVLSKRIKQAEMEPCWTLMAGFENPLETQIAYEADCKSPIAVISRETAKPRRDLPGDGWVIQANADWTRAHLELEQEEIIALLLPAFFRAVGCDPIRPVISMAHRWRYGLTATPLGQPYVLDKALGLSICGDWCIGKTAQAAFDSGCSLAAALIEGA